MAYTPCAANVAANIAKDCDHPSVGGYTGRAVLIPLSYSPTIVASSANPRILTSISVGSGQKTIAVDNVWADPFNGSATQSNGDAGRIKFGKTFTLRVPLRGAATSKDIVEPLANNALGFLLIVEKKDRVGDGSYEVVGYLEGLKTNADGIVRNEYENGGDIVVTMSCSEDFFEVTMFNTDYATTKGDFEDLLAGSF